MKDLVERQAVLDLIHENWYASNEFYLKQIEGLPGIDVPEDDEEFQRELCWEIFNASAAENTMGIIISLLRCPVKNIKKDGISGMHLITLKER